MILAEADVNNTEMQDFLYRDRTKLSVYGLVTFGLGLETVAQQDRLTMVVRNIEQFLIQDEANEHKEERCHVRSMTDECTAKAAAKPKASATIR